MVADRVSVEFFRAHNVNDLSFREAQTGSPRRTIDRDPQSTSLKAAKLYVIQGVRWHNP